LAKILVLNGPNLNLLGLRQPEVYGRATLADVEALCRGAAGAHAVECRQTNHEGEMLDWVHAARGTAGGIVVNAGAWTHTSIALLDALNVFEGPVFEVHISNIHRREPFRHHSYVSGRADGVIVGFGVEGYAMAVRRMAEILA
jgi:3-dehydroquinate dehydratase-2